MNWTHGLKIHTYAKQNPRSLQNQSIYIHTEIELSYTTKLKKKISRTKTITQDLICHNRTPLERERERETWTALWKMPPRPIPSLKILLIWRMVLLVLSDPLFVTSYTCNFTSTSIGIIFFFFFTKNSNSNPNSKP